MVVEVGVRSEDGEGGTLELFSLESGRLCVCVCVCVCVCDSESNTFRIKYFQLQ